MDEQLFKVMTRWIRVALASLLFAAIAFGSCDEENLPPVEPASDFNQLSPVNGTKDTPVLTTFSWELSERADHYTLVVSAKSDFTVPALEMRELTETEFTTGTPLEAGKLYFWKVIAFNSAAEVVARNAGMSFRTKATPPVASPQQSRYYVSPQGEDNPDRGTIESPFKTLAYAATRVPSGEGDTIYLKAGIFEETEPAVIPLGVSVIGSGESTTILTSSGVTLPPGINKNSPNFKLWYDGSLIQLVSSHRSVFRNNNSPASPPANGNQTISGFTIDGKNKSLKVGVWVENRNNVTMHHVTFKNLDQRGAVFGPGDKDFYVYPEHYMTGTLIHDCTFINSGKDIPSESLGNLCIAQLDGAEIYNIVIQDNQGYGIKFIYDGYFKNLNIHDCQISLNESDSKWGEDIAIELWNLGPGNKISNITCNTWLSIVNHPEIFATPGTANMKVSKVRMIDIDGISSKEAVEIGAPGVEIHDSYFENKGLGIAIWDMGRENITIRNNIFYNSIAKNNWASGAAVYIDNSREWPFKNINIYNNIFDTHTIAVKIKGGNISDINVKNNAFLNTGTADIEAVGNTIQSYNNLKYKNGINTWLTSGVTSEGNNIIGDPLFFKTGSRWDTFYKPVSDLSFVINKGADVGIPFNGSAPDIGVFEFE